MIGLRRAAEPRGQALVEFAMAISIFVIILVGLFDLGRGVFNYNTLSQASREGARLASVQASWIGDTGSDCFVPNSDCPANAAALKARVVAAVNERASGLGTITDAQVKVFCGTAPQPDNSSWTDGGCDPATVAEEVVTVRVEFTFNPMINIGSIDMSSQTTMVVN